MAQAFTRAPCASTASTTPTRCPKASVTPESARKCQESLRPTYTCPMDPNCLNDARNVSITPAKHTSCRESVVTRPKSIYHARNAFVTPKEPTSDQQRSNTAHPRRTASTTPPRHPKRICDARKTSTTRRCATPKERALVTPEMCSSRPKSPHPANNTPNRSVTQKRLTASTIAYPTACTMPP
ncbi:hypothetical protein BDN67DRAFT_972648 [Paxillus ammoniavirescens]|nr:hypothetical protein BDN67DRAFT_972648 [Paxillus ammoniavirescens]